MGRNKLTEKGGHNVDIQFEMSPVNDEHGQAPGQTWHQEEDKKQPVQYNKGTKETIGIETTMKVRCTFVTDLPSRLNTFFFFNSMDRRMYIPYSPPTALF